MVYGYLQKQQYQEAYQLVKTMMKIAEESNTPMTKFHYALMRAAYMIESRDWEANLKSLDMHEMEPASRATDIYTNAMQAFLDAYDEYINELKSAPNRFLTNKGLKITIEKIRQQGLPVPQGIRSYFNKLMIDN